MNNKYGTIFIFLSAALFSLGGLCVKMIPWAALSINGARCIISVTLLTAYLIISKQKIKFNKWVLLGALCISGTNILYTAANKLTTAANTIVLQFTAPIFIIFLMWIFFRRRPQKLDVFTCLIVFMGIICFFVDSLSSGGIAGNILALLSGLTYAGVFMMNELPDGNPFSSTFFGQLIGAAAGLPYLIRETDFSAVPLTFILILGIFQMGIAYICFCIGIKRTSPIAASLISGIEPILNPVWVALFYKESLGALSILGSGIVVVSIVVYNIIKNKSSALE